MKKNSKNSKSPTRSTKTKRAKTDEVTIGRARGNKTSRYCVLNAAGEVLLEGSCATTKAGMAQVFGAMPRCRIAIEGGADSPWVSRTVKRLRYGVIVGHAR